MDTSPTSLQRQKDSKVCLGNFNSEIGKGKEITRTTKAYGCAVVVGNTNDSSDRY